MNALKNDTHCFSSIIMGLVHLSRPADATYHFA